MAGSLEPHLQEGQLPIPGHAQGLCKSIGVSNCSIKCLEALLPQCKIRPAVNQVEVRCCGNAATGGQPGW